MKNLPWEIWSLIFEFFRENNGTFLDLFSLCLSSDEFYSIIRLCPSQPALLNEANITWKSIPTILELASNPTYSPIKISRIFKRIRSIIVPEADTKEQWRKASVLAELVSKCPNIQKIRIATHGGSGWLKELKPELESLKNLELVASGGDGKRGTLGGMIYTEHVKIATPKLESLSLTGIQIYGSQGIGFLGSGFLESSTSPGPSELNASFIETLRSITLTNCQWSFPYKLDELGAMKSITIRIAYSYLLNNAQMRELLSNPPSTCETLVLDVGMNDIFEDQIKLAKEMNNHAKKSQWKLLAEKKKLLFPNNVTKRSIIVHTNNEEDSEDILEYTDTDTEISYKFTYATSKHLDPDFYCM